MNSSNGTIESKNLFLNSDQLKALAEENNQSYISGQPFPNIYFDNFFDPEILNSILEEFPGQSDIEWKKFENNFAKKLATRNENQFGPSTKAFLHVLNSQPFIQFLEILTGIENLIPDPNFEGAGLHQILPGGLLKIHAYFNKHPRFKLEKRLNVLIYLNKDWKEEYGGHFELWPKDMSKAAVKILPVFNRLALFSTTSNSYHGHPDALTCPEVMSRKSIALYYYTNGRPASEIDESLGVHTTLFQKRTNDKN